MIKEPLGEDLVLDELLDLTLYQELFKHAQGTQKDVLGELIPVEQQHLAFWKKFFQLEIGGLDAGRRVKLAVLVRACRLLGPSCVNLVLEAIEIYGVRKYLEVWETYKDQPLGAAVQGILKDEFEHEDVIVSKAEGMRIDPQRISGIFLGFNDGLVEILGAVSGFFAAFSQRLPVLMAGLSVAAAGAFSMGAGAFTAASSENEMARTDAAKRRFLGQGGGTPAPPGALRSGLTVGVSYFFGALVPILPVLFGARSILGPVLMALVLIIAVSMILAFLSGMDIKRRILTNLALMSGAVALAYAVGRAVREVWGLSL